MKQVFQNFKTGKLELVEIPTPTLKPGFLLVKNHYSLISPGTEKAAIELAQKNLLAKARSRPDQVKKIINKIKTDGLITTFGRVMKKLDEPLALGYSSAGEVVGVGSEAEEFKVGDRVACGGGGWACHADVISVPKNLCVRIPENVSYQEACFATIGAIAMQGIRRAELTSGEKVAVIGLGLIGQLTCQILKGYGYPVIGFDISTERVNEAIAQGIEAGGQPDRAGYMVQTFTNGHGVDAVIITAASKSNAPIELAGTILRNGGRVSVVGDVPMDVPRRTYYKKELDVRVSCSYGPGRYDKNYEEKGLDYPFGRVRWTEKRNMEEIIRLVQKKLIRLEPLITHTFPLEQAHDAYDLILKNTNKEKITAVLFSYKTGEPQSDTFFFKEPKAYQPASQIRIGLIGAGNFAQNIVVPSLQKIKEASIHAACDARGIHAKKIISSAKGAYITTDWHKIINDKEINLVIISTRHNLHAPMIIEALKNNKNVHVEKPLCLNKQELKDIKAAAESSTGRLMVGFNRRFARLTRQAKQLFKRHEPLMILCRINAGVVPKDHWVHDPQEGGGRILGEACHFIDLCHFFAGVEADRIYASTIPVEGAIESEDNAAITIDFKNGTRGIIIYTSLAPTTLPKEHIEIIGGNQAFVIDNFKDGIIYSKNTTKKIRSFSQDKGHLDQFKSLIDAIIGGQPSPIPLKEIIFSTQATLNAFASSKEQKVTPTTFYDTKKN